MVFLCENLITLTACSRAAKRLKFTLRLSPITCREPSSKREAISSPRNSSTDARKTLCTNLSDKTKRQDGFVTSCRIFIYFQPNSFSAEASFTLTQKICIAASSSSRGGYVGAILMFLSSGSLPYGKVAPAEVRTTPASLQS